MQYLVLNVRFILFYNQITDYFLRINTTRVANKIINDNASYTVIMSPPSKDGDEPNSREWLFRYYYIAEIID